MGPPLLCTEPLHFVIHHSSLFGPHCSIGVHTSPFSAQSHLTKFDLICDTVHDLSCDLIQGHQKTERLLVGRRATKSGLLLLSRPKALVSPAGPEGVAGEQAGRRRRRHSLNPPKHSPLQAMVVGEPRAAQASEK